MGQNAPFAVRKTMKNRRSTIQKSAKRHTSKHITITHPKTQRILAVSEEAPGTKHDKKMMDEAQISCETALPVRGDSGFQGLSIGNAEIIVPCKLKRAKKGKPRTELT